MKKRDCINLLKPMIKNDWNKVGSSFCVQNPNLKGILFSGNYAYATNAFVLAKIQTDPTPPNKDLFYLYDKDEVFEENPLISVGLKEVNIRERIAKGGWRNNIIKFRIDVLLKLIKEHCPKISQRRKSSIEIRAIKSLQKCIGKIYSKNQDHVEISTLSFWDLSLHDFECSFAIDVNILTKCLETLKGAGYFVAEVCFNNGNTAPVIVKGTNNNKPLLKFYIAQVVI